MQVQPPVRRPGRVLDRLGPPEEVPAGGRLLDTLEARHRTAVEHPSAALARPGADVDHPVRASYDVQVARDGDTAFGAGSLAIDRTGVRTAAFTPSLPLPASSTPYVWHVRRIDAFGNRGPWSAPEQFSRVVSVCIGQTAGTLNPAPACADFLRNSPHAAQEWELERRFQVFEAGTQ